MSRGPIPHGTYNGYNNYGCRCEHCGYANSAYHSGYRLRQRLGSDPAVEAYNAAVIRARILTWRAVHEAGRSVSVCDDIIAHRPIPARLFAAVLAVELPLEEAA